MTSNEIEIMPDAAPFLPAPAGTAAAAMEMLMAHAQMMDTAHKLAEAMVKTDMVPVIYRRKDQDATAAILYGLELGLSPIQSLQNVISVHGKPTVEARTMVALLQAKGYRFKVHENTDVRTTIQGWSPDGSRDETVTWTIEDAIKAEFVPQIDPATGTYALNANGKLKGNMKYLTQPRQMLYAKAAGELCRHLAPDVLLGIAYTREDLESEPTPPEPVRVTSERVTVPVPEAGAAEPAVPIKTWQPPVPQQADDGSTPVVSDAAPENPESNSAPPSDDINAGADRVRAARDEAIERARQEQAAAEKPARQRRTRAKAAEAAPVSLDLAAQLGEARQLLEQLGADTTEKRLAYYRTYFDRPDLDDPRELSIEEVHDVIAELRRQVAAETKAGDQ
ncbi:prolipoprotein diacylglyceryl transferase [Nocardia farcinica]|uniref:hypothetical protein n=1 Tax=Nocardia farcinica TaxID=37329 RepID=UPI001895F623|nr:hypothetical protein [Nocardia farcinica]MBF6411234.1 hypothetical protein [Nocardia farcinica]